MDRHLGASITLSFALVAVFAILLYQPEHTPLPRAEADVPAGEPERAGPGSHVRMPALTPTEPLAARPPRPASVPVTGEMRPIATAAASEGRPDSEPPTPKGKVAANRPTAKLTAHQSFTETLEGETLRDVAIRVYGSPEEVEWLWRLNRDLIRRREVALPSGTLLRTP